jgi:hypothetical protein
VLVEAVPEPGPGGKGRIGVSLTPGTYINHLKGDSVAQNLAIVNAEFAKCGCCCCCWL